MSGSVQYSFLDPVTGTEVPLNSINIGVDDAARFVTVETTSLTDIGPDVGFTSGFVEEVDGVQIGSIGLSRSAVVLDTFDPSTGLYTTEIFATGIGVDGEFDAFPCFATGTLIQTDRGLVAVDDLVAGVDSVTLATGGSARVAWVGHRRQHNGSVVRVRTSALGPQQPTHDLVLSEDHGLYLDGVLVQAGLLVNSETVVREHRDEVTFWHVELDRHAILLANGAPAESYLDTGNRRQFSNSALTYDPAVPSSQNPFAEMVFAGTRLEAIRARLRHPEPAILDA